MAEKPTGASGTLIIDDIDGRVYFRIRNTQGSTFANGKSWSGTVNGVSVGGTFSISGAETVTVGSWAVSSAQTVTFAIGATGTAGLGGPTSFSVGINRAPGAPGAPSLVSVSGDSVTLTWAAASGDVTDYGVYVSVSSSFSSHVFQDWVGPGRTFTVPGLNDGVQYYARVRARNASGGGPYSGVRSFTTVPDAPSSLSVSRVSDSQQSLSWTRNATYSSVVVQRRTDGGSWQAVGSAAGNAASFTDTTTSGNHKYEYRVAGVAGGRQSSWSGMATVYTTPAKPSTPSAVRDGNDIIVSASGVSSIATGVDVRDGSTVVASNVSLPWTHVSPSPSVPHTYTIRAVRGSLASAYSSASNTVQLIAPPNAPVNLSPNGAVVPSDADVVFSWTHNPVDSSPQSAFELQWRPSGGSWTTVSGTTASSTSVALTAGSFEWQVRTKGAHVDWSPWSAVATVEVVDRPGVAIVGPDDVWDSSVLTVEWSWFQAQSRPQSAWEARLSSGSDVVESKAGSGAGTSVTFGHRLAEGEWTVEVRAATGGVWSEWAPETFTVAFVPPAHPIVEAAWDEVQGAVSLDVQSGDPASSPPAVTNLVTNPSFKVGSGTVEVRRNLHSNPRLTVGSTGWYRSADCERMAVVIPGRPEIAFAWWSGGTVPVGSTRTAGATFTGLTAGKTYTARLLVLAEATGWIFTAWDGVIASPTILTPLASRTLAAGPDWREETITFVAASTSASVGIRAPSGAPDSAYGLTGAVVQEGTVAGAFFDGGFSPDPDLTASWTGSADGSPSILTGVTVTGMFTQAGQTTDYQITLGDGTKGVRSVSVTSSAKGINLNNMVNLSADTEYTMLLRARASKTGAVTPRVRGTTVADVTLTTEWRDIRITARAGADGNTGFLISAGAAFPAGEWIEIAKATIVEGTYTGPWFDGDSGSVVIDGVERRTQWDGTPNASTSSTLDMPPTTSVVVERSIDGDTWELVLETVEQANFLDWESWSYGDILYRATAFTVEGATAVTETTVEARSWALWLSGGVGFGAAVRLPFNPSAQITASRDRALKQYAGRKNPVAYVGEATTRTVSVSGMTADRMGDEVTATPDELEALAQNPGRLFMFRDPDGRRIYGTIGEISLPRQATSPGGDTLRPWNGYWGYSFTLTEAT